MYAITGDYFDSFSATFGPKECLLGGTLSPWQLCHSGFGHGPALLRKIERATAEFKLELQIFLSARTASSAAVAQQKDNELWELPGQLSGYKERIRFSDGASELFRVMREDPDRTDDAVTDGTNYHRALVHWLDRLERPPHQMEEFIRNTDFLLTEHFEKLTSRAAATTADATSWRLADMILCTVIGSLRAKQNAPAVR